MVALIRHGRVQGVLRSLFSIFTMPLHDEISPYLANNEEQLRRYEALKPMLETMHWRRWEDLSAAMMFEGFYGPVDVLKEVVAGLDAVLLAVKAIFETERETLGVATPDDLDAFVQWVYYHGRQPECPWPSVRAVGVMLEGHLARYREIGTKEAPSAAPSALPPIVIQ